MSDHALLFHAAPIHYVPHILRDGALYAASVLAPRGIAPRVTAARRDRALGLSDWVHLSLRPNTPLLRDKVRKGYPHVLLAFDRERVWAGANVALLPYNAKAWRTRAALSPVTEAAEKDVLLAAHARARYPSLETLVKYGLGWDALHTIAFLTDNERQLTTGLLSALGMNCPAPCTTRPEWFGPVDTYRPVTGDAIRAYFDACRAAGQVLPPPAIPFD